MCGDRRKRHCCRPKRQRGSDHDQTHGLVEDHGLEWREPKRSDQQRQAEFRAAQTDQAAERADDGAAQEGSRCIAFRRQACGKHGGSARYIMGYRVPREHNHHSLRARKLRLLSSGVKASIRSRLRAGGLLPHRRRGDQNRRQPPPQQQEQAQRPKSRCRLRRLRRSRSAPSNSARFNKSRAYRRGRRLSNEAGHGDTSHNDRITFGTENCERQRASGDAFETDASAIER